jgi:DNA-binding response OmpR family regulator
MALLAFGNARRMKILLIEDGDDYPVKSFAFPELLARVHTSDFRGT